MLAAGKQFLNFIIHSTTSWRNLMYFQFPLTMVLQELWNGISRCLAQWIHVTLEEPQVQRNSFFLNGQQSNLWNLHTVRGLPVFLFERDIITVFQYCWYYNQPGKIAHGKMIVFIHGIIRDPWCISVCLTTITKYLMINDDQKKCICLTVLETNYISWLPQFILCWASEVLGIMEKRVSWQIKRKCRYVPDFLLQSNFAWE